ncbi:LysR family transcriptional regulator [Microbacterium dextranolyticum]|uniref:LysR family transcriptional regulator n=1 Tax=Microbacterium dextranolyticum TaxID=36806 RepID=A0A9W6HPB6_9MICO|nr:LysR family transcriptional regulator [Microbacterium dextranolyticum]MBM7462717.1 DNA-binding transcriptional LysR family regulator [Microbacterium dextranolyticum]GLJ96178.1 LysR family transcriptional regulator [Microbacterium dextranolyticum]
MDDLAADLDLQSLRIVRAIGDTGSITGAAAVLGYSQPTISQHLRRLESRLDIAVVERVGRGVRLTEAGRILARHAVEVMLAVEAAAEELAQLQGLRTGVVRLVAFPSTSPVIVPRVIAALAAAHPGLTLTYVEAEPPEAVEAIREDRADIALTFSYPGDRADPHGASARGLSVRGIGSDDLMLVLPSGHPAARSLPGMIDVAALADETWIAGCPRCRGHLLELCGRAGFSPRIGFETDNAVAVEGLVAQGIGIATLPRMAVESFPPLAGVVAAPLPAVEARRLHLVTARDAERVPSLRAALDTVRAVLGERLGAVAPGRAEPGESTDAATRATGHPAAAN